MTTVAGHEMVDRELSLMGTHIRVLVGPAARPGIGDPVLAADRVERMLTAYDDRLSRFKPGSELCALNADTREVVPASGLLRAAVRAALEAAELTGGLVDPAVLDDLEASGYRESWKPAHRVPLAAALSEVRAPRTPASANPRSAWREVLVDDDGESIARPPGLRLDTGGTGKGHAADLAATLLEGYETWAVDCGGDLRIGGDAGALRDVEVEHPFTGETLETLRVRDGAVATSGLRSRIWRGADGRVAHHLLDPSTGRPAYTGIVAVTALAPSAVHAEALAKAVLLSGPGAAPRLLAPHGGIAVLEDGGVLRAGPLEPRRTVRLRMPAGAAA